MNMLCFNNRNMFILVRLVLLIQLMISSVSSETSATFAQIIAATEVAYVLQETYNNCIINVSVLKSKTISGKSVN